MVNIYIMFSVDDLSIFHFTSSSLHFCDRHKAKINAMISHVQRLTRAQWPSSNSQRATGMGSQQGWDLSTHMSNSMVRQLILVNWEILKIIDWSRVRKIPLSPGEKAKFVSKCQYVDKGEQTFFTERSPRTQGDSENACRHGWMSTNCPEGIKLRIFNQL